LRPWPVATSAKRSCSRSSPTSRRATPFDDDDVRTLGARLAEPRTSNLVFAERFVTDHNATFDRLSQ
jgi:hypothetical protein